MIICDRGRQIIMDAEGLRLEAYRCPAGVWTIGYGHTGDVKEGQKITKHMAEVILEYDLTRFEQAVTRLAPKATGPQFSAMVSLCFNIGITAFEGSALLRLFRAGDLAGAAVQFDRWVYSGGKVLPGLVKRRAAERALFVEVPS
jgi:lysozyme